MPEWEKVGLSECEKAKCICPQCVHQNERKRNVSSLDEPERSCCARHANASGVTEAPDDICGIAECPDFQKAVK